MSNKMLKPISLAVGAAFLGSVAFGAYAGSLDATDLSSGYMLVGGDKAKEEGKCGEGKCGGDKAKEEGKCGGAA